MEKKLLTKALNAGFRAVISYIQHPVTEIDSELNIVSFS